MASISSIILLKSPGNISEKTFRISTWYIRCVSCYRGHTSATSLNFYSQKISQKKFSRNSENSNIDNIETLRLKSVDDVCKSSTSLQKSTVFSRGNLYLANSKLNGPLSSYRFSSYSLNARINSNISMALIPNYKKRNVFQNQPVHMYSTGTQVIGKPGILSRLWSKVAPKKLRYKSGTLNRSGYRLYCCVDEFVDYMQFIQEFDLPDTFASWFTIMELHAWMVMVRLSTEGDEGNAVRQSVLKAMWADVESRSKKIGSDPTERKKGVKQLADMFIAGIFAYDEGLLSDDKTLAAAVWRIIFNMKDVDPEKIELMVHYIRKQVKFMENQNSELILRNGILSFLPLHAEKMDTEYEKRTIAKAMNK